MAKCATCGQELADGTKFCSGCGAPMKVPEPAAGAKCASCGADNPGGGKFCVACGKPLAAPQAAPQTQAAPSGRCPSCATENTPGSKFCVGCGATLQSQPRPAAASAAPPTYGASAAVIAPQPLNKHLKVVRNILFAAVALQLLSAIGLYGLMSQVQQMSGLYADTSGIAFLIFACLVIAAFLAYAAIQLPKGQTKFAKGGVIVLAAFGALNLIAGGFEDKLALFVSVAMIAAGAWAWLLLKRVEQARI